MGVMEIAAELYRNPLLRCVMELAAETDAQTLRILTDYLNSKKEIEMQLRDKSVK